MSRIAIIGSGPTGIYTLKGLLESDAPLAITIYEANADPGKGTPYHPRANDRAMLANIASIELPPVTESLTAWLRRKTPPELAMLGVEPKTLENGNSTRALSSANIFKPSFKPFSQRLPRGATSSTLRQIIAL